MLGIIVISIRLTHDLLADGLCHSMSDVHGIRFFPRGRECGSESRILGLATLLPRGFARCHISAELKTRTLTSTVN